MNAECVTEGSRGADFVIFGHLHNLDVAYCAEM